MVSQDLQSQVDGRTFPETGRHGEYYVPDYEFADQHAYASTLTSSEHVFAWPAVKLVWALLFELLGYRMLQETTSQYAAVPAFTLTFHRIAATGDRIGLEESYRKYEGMHAYSPGSPIEDRAWGEEFLKRVSPGEIAAVRLIWEQVKKSNFR